MVHKLQNEGKTQYERYVDESTVFAAGAWNESKNGCCGCLFWFIVIIFLLALIL